MNATPLHHRTRRSKAERRITKIASTLRLGTRLLMLLIVLFFIWMAVSLLFLMPNSDVSFLSQLVASDSGASISLNISQEVYKVGFSSYSKLVLLSFVTLFVLWSLYCITRIHYLLGNFQRSKIFVKRNTNLLRNLGYALILGIIFKWVTWSWMVLQSESSLAQSWMKLIPIEFVLNSFFNGTSIVKILLIGSFFLSAWVIEIGCELYNDSEYTI